MGSVYVRGSVLWLAYKEVNGERVCKKTPYRTDGEGADKAHTLARGLLAQIERDVKKGIPANAAPRTLRDWAQDWTATRERGSDEMNMFEKYAAGLLPMRLDRIKPRDIKAWVEYLKSPELDLAARTIWHRYSHLKTCLRDAVVAELIVATPCVLPRGTLPPRIDKDPTWRDGAIFTLSELIQMISDERIDLRYRVMYALKGLTGARHGEVVGLTWDEIDWQAKPLPRIRFAYQYEKQRTKTGATKIPPMHPTLNAILTAWRAVWPSLYGREPLPTDRVVGLIPDGKCEHSSVANPALQEHLALLGLRARDGHDFRSTFISITCEAGAPEYIVKSITHPKPVVKDAFEAYLKAPYDKQCAAVLKLSVPVPAWAQSAAAGTTEAQTAPAGENLPDANLTDESKLLAAVSATEESADQKVEISKVCYSSATFDRNHRESLVSDDKTVLGDRGGFGPGVMFTIRASTA